MKNILYALIISIIFSGNICYPMQQSIPTEKISILVYITAGCGIFLYIANQYKHLFLNWFKSFYHKASIYKPNNSINNNNLSSLSIKNPTQSLHTNNMEQSIKQQNSSKQNLNSIIIPKITAEVLNQSTTQYLQKKETQRKNKIKNTTELHIACENNDIQSVKLLLKISTTDINAKRDPVTYHPMQGDIQERGKTSLHIACHNNNTEIVEILLACNNIDITIREKDGNIPLHIACKMGNQEIVQKLLMLNASNINTQNNKDESAIYLAYFHKHTNIFSLLFNQDNIDLTNILSLACSRNDMNMITQLLNHKNIKLDNNQPLYIACENGYVDIVTLLLSYNKNDCIKINNINYSEGYNPLLIACKKIKNPNLDRIKFVTIIKALLNDPAIDINTQTRKGTVFHFIVSDCELLQLLLNKDHRFINEKNKKKPTTPLHKAIKSGNLKSIFLLLQYGADINIKNYYEQTPFALACLNASVEIKETTYTNIVKNLLNSTYVNQETINSSESLYHCILGLKKEKINNVIPKLLLSYGADPNKIHNEYNSPFKRKYNFSPLLEIACHNNLPLLNLFIDQYNGDITQKTSDHQTVLYKAFMSHSINNPNEINFFKNLNKNEKNIFMKRELTIIANSAPRDIFVWKNSWDDFIKLFNSFIATCIHHGKIDLHTTIVDNQTLFDIAYKKLQERHKNFYSSEQKKCMHPNDSICRYDHDRWNHKSYNGCDDCRDYFPYNELIMHTLIQHINPTTIEQAVDKAIACTYKEKPTEYYLKKPKEKENQKNYLREQIEQLNQQ